MIPLNSIIVIFRFRRARVVCLFVFLDCCHDSWDCRIYIALALSFALVAYLMAVILCSGILGLIMLHGFVVLHGLSDTLLGFRVICVIGSLI